MAGRLFMRLFAGLVAAATLGGLAWINLAPPPRLALSRDGVPLLAPPVLDPNGGAPLPVAALARHYKGIGP